jgi:hypothetical protein
MYICKYVVVRICKLGVEVFMYVEIVPRPKRAEKDKYGETKQRYQIMLTETASAELDKVSEQLRITRSELIEMVIRQGLLKEVKLDFDQNIDD